MCTLALPRGHGSFTSGPTFNCCSLSNLPTPGSECILQNIEIVEEEMAMAYLVTSKATFMFSNAKPVLNENQCPIVSQFGKVMV